MTICWVLCILLGNPQTLAVVLVTSEHRPVELGTKMISDLDRLSLRYSLSYLTCYLFIVLPGISLVLIWSLNSTNIVDHPTFWKHDFIAFYWSFVMGFTSYSLPLTNLQAHDFRFLGPLLFSWYPFYVGTLIHTYSFKYLLCTEHLHIYSFGLELPFRL